MRSIAVPPVGAGAVAAGPGGSASVCDDGGEQVARVRVAGRSRANRKAWRG
jgi:hypothetical protein